MKGLDMLQILIAILLTTGAMFSLVFLTPANENAMKEQECLTKYQELDVTWNPIYEGGDNHKACIIRFHNVNLTPEQYETISDMSGDCYLEKYNETMMGYNSQFRIICE